MYIENKGAAEKGTQQCTNNSAKHMGV